MVKRKYKVGIVIPQWNGAADTINCLKSLLPDLHQLPSKVVIVDNGSSDGSVARLQHFFRETAIDYKEYQLIGKETKSLNFRTTAAVTLLVNSDNAGFAAACNLGMKLIGSENVEWFLLLNNDTIANARFLHRLLAVAERNPEFEVWAPVITYLDKPQLIWDIGGELTLGGDRTFPGRKRLRANYPYSGFQKRSFLTGCALLIKAETILAIGYLTERFFFGEEDFWLAHRLKRDGRQMAVCWESEIKHKVMTSIKKISPDSIVPLVYIHNLNRLIDMRFWLKPVIYPSWKIFYLIYATVKLWWKNWIPGCQLLRFIKLLLRNSKTKRQVTKEDFLGAKELFQ